MENVFGKNFPHKLIFIPNTGRERRKREKLHPSIALFAWYHIYLIKMFIDYTQSNVFQSKMSCLMQTIVYHSIWFIRSMIDFCGSSIRFKCVTLSEFWAHKPPIRFHMFYVILKSKNTCSLYGCILDAIDRLNRWKCFDQNPALDLAWIHWR